jgi:predicted aspartyl protease
VRRLALILVSFSLTGVVAAGFFPPRGDAAAAARELAGEADGLLRAGMFEPAERAYRAALAQDAASGAAHLGFARVLAARRDIDWALAEAELAASLPPAGADALVTLASLRESAGDLRGASDALARYVAAGSAEGHPLARLLRARSWLSFLRLAGDVPLRQLFGERSVTVPFDIVSDKILFKASINGRVPIDVVLDTGAEHVVVSDWVADKAGLARAGRTSSSAPDLALIDTLDIAGLSIRRVPALVRNEPLRTIPNRGGESLSPLALGLSLAIDYSKRELTIGRRLGHGVAEIELPLHVPGLPIVTAMSGAAPLSMVVDTGSAATAVSPETLARLAAPSAARRIPMRLFDALGRQQPDAYLLTPGIDLSLGSIALEGYPVLVRSWRDVEDIHGVQVGGVLGHNFLRHYRVTFDLSRRVLGLTGKHSNLAPGETMR